VADPAAIQARIERARALAAAHQLNAAASELEAIRKTFSDDMVHNITSVMLMGIYLEEGNYVRAESLLEEDFRGRVSGNNAALRTYFATAGQALNGARQHLARYRSFGINVSDSDLPAEAVVDLNRLRRLLDRMIAQAQEISSQRKTYDVLALLEDVLSIRLSLATDGEDRAKWEAEYANARRILASSQSQIASLGIPSLQRSVPPTTGDSAPAVKELPATTAEIITPPATSSATKPIQSAPATVTQPTSAAPTPKVDGNNTISTGSLNTRATKRVVPIYPPLAKTMGAVGVVRVYVTVDESGKVAQVTSIEGPMVLRQAAEDAAKGWRFLPTAVEGKAVKLAGFIEFTFTK
jgi:TonB family protein